MNFISPPSATSRVSHRPGDDLDGLLSAFYQAEIPNPWPELEPPVVTVLPPTRLAFWRRVKRSHLALAASVALLIASSLLFAGKAPLYRVNPPPDPTDTIGTKPHETFNEIDPKNISTKESILVTPEGAAVQFELDENRY